MRIYLVFFIIQSFFSAALAADCKALKDPRAHVADPILVSNPTISGLYLFAHKNIEMLCSIVEESKQNHCLTKALNILNEATSCLDEKLLVHESRPLAWAFLRNLELEVLITEAVFKKAHSLDEKSIQKNIWQKYQVLLLPGGIIAGNGTTKKWRVEDLKQIEKGFEKLASTIGNESHIWGAGGTLARLGEKSVSGQFGEVYNNYPMQVNVVIDVLKENKSALLIAQQLAHENAHSNDHLRGRLLTGDYSSWSETEYAGIFQACELEADYKTSLIPCLKSQPKWFNFHPTSYSAIRSAEFYTKMVDQWVREKLNISRKNTYRCQSAETLSFWNEMEVNLLGKITSPPCP